ncbi:MAG: pyridoxamine 5'-phosphate oxidase family protein [Alphaproteobacteria bacterium]|nr:pyridoxamine 5'-phosphate oxidase family protein [Alphaproteobacteria bacterium]
MGHRFSEIAFTDTVKQLQEKMGSRGAYAQREGGAASNAALGPREAAFLALRDSFYMASVGETGWPYVQHRGGPAGFVRVLDAKTIGFADFRGNRQYVSVGNVTTDNRVSLFFMDYPNQARLKIFGRAKLIGDEAAETLSELAVPDYRAKVERGFLIEVEAFDWNCPQHITPRYTLAEIETATAPLRARIAELEGLVAAKA